ncbi:AMP-binding protein [Microbacterium sp. zg-Y818]|uniref:class I adenylate-forming enzyme family protein n=1 Tax=unclassified Microbacterium TaxID=2609290 RepID=UPI00214CBC17|nr:MULTISPECIES: AMP-binding protein [unclassified Microbacterium]MCR2799357.1 AMP-binding protein [Microbacterium sp. zg.Y818]WIM21356.1 AMP-binding protein [Microbacterium sp. zg-Y818]
MNVFMLLDMLADTDPERVIVGDRTVGLTYAALRDEARRAAGRLHAEGALPLVYVTVASEAYPIALFGAALAGTPFVPVSYRLATGPLGDILRDQSPALLVAEASVLALGADVAGREIVPVDARGFRAAIHDSASFDAAAPDDDEAPAVLLHTSGTTGKPKVAILRHRHLTSYVLSSVDFLSSPPDEAQLVAVPPYHIAGVAGMLTALYSGRRIVYLPNFDAAEWVRVAREQRITHAMVVPTMLARIVEVLAQTGQTLPDLRNLSYGGGRMPLSVVAPALDLLPHVDFVNGYGLTETTSSIAVLGPEDHRQAIASDDPAVRRRLGSVGRALPSVELIACDPAGRVLGPDERGELWVRGPQVSGEYSHSSVTDEDGWFHTNDAGWIDADGYVFVDGRLDDVIVRGGENLSPGEIEEVLTAHAAVAEAAVVGVQDDQWGEIAVAAVVAAPGYSVTEAELKSWVGAQLRSTRVPERVLFREALPYNETGKLLRRVLKTELMEAQHGA